MKRIRSLNEPFIGIVFNYLSEISSFNLFRSCLRTTAFDSVLFCMKKKIFRRQFSNQMEISAREETETNKSWERTRRSGVSDNKIWLQRIHAWSVVNDVILRLLIAFSFHSSRPVKRQSLSWKTYWHMCYSEIKFSSSNRLSMHHSIFHNCFAYDIESQV